MGGGGDDTGSEQARLWSGTHEVYRLAEAGSGTLLAISAPVEDACYDDVAGAWDRALAVVEELSEVRGDDAPSAG